MEKFNILLVEDDESDSKAMVEEIARTENFLLAKATNSCIEAYDYIVNSYPSAVILDLEMNMGYGDGMELLAKLRAANLKHVPYIVVTTNNVSTVTLNRTKQLGAGYGFCKSKPDYSPKMVMDHLKAMLLREPEERAKELAAQREQRLTVRLRGIFDNLKIERNLGYDYLLRSIIIYMETKDRDFAKQLAAETGKSVDSIKKAAGYALDTAWSTGNTEKLEQYYGGPIKDSTMSPAYTSFVYYYANLLENEF